MKVEDIKSLVFDGQEVVIVSGCKIIFDGHKDSIRDEDLLNRNVTNLYAYDDNCLYILV